MKYTDMIMPCCKTLLPAPIDMVESIQCNCGQVYTRSEIEEYNEMIKE